MIVDEALLIYDRALSHLVNANDQEKNLKQK